MTRNRTRLAFAGTAALAALMAVGSIAGAQSTTQGGTGNGFSLQVGQGQGQAGRDRGQTRGMGHGEMGHGEMGGGRHGGPGDMDGDRGMPGGPLGELAGGGTVIRAEAVVELADGTFATRRLERGTVTAAAADAITFTLATGESVTVSIGADTIVEDAHPFGGPHDDMNGDPFGRGWSNDGGQGVPDPAAAPATIDPATIAVGAEVMVASESQADGTWLAIHLHLLPPAPTDAVAPGASLAPAANG
jgi:hypothetical protein